MTNEEAMHIISKICPDYEDEEIEAKFMAIDALEKQSEAEEYRTPKKVERFRFEDDVWVCPSCKMGPQPNNRRYCSNCGQALDWSEVE